MAYAATADGFLPSMTAAPGVLALQRALLWLVGASCAMVLSEDTAARLDMIRRGLIVGALIAALGGIAGYFSLFPGAHSLLTLYDRASGTFKDPNVFSAFLILPALFALQSVVSDSLGKSFRSTVTLGILSLALLLAFSRAAWGGLDRK